MPPGVGRGPWPCGRGAPPGPPCGRGAPGAPGAPGRGAPPGRGACGRAMPVEPPEVKGLLPGRGPAGRPPGRGARSPWAPGRGPPGRPPSRWPAGPGRAPGRGPGVAPGRGAAGRSWAGRSCEGAAGAGAENSAAGTGVTGAGLAGAAGAGLGPGRGPGVGAAPAGLGVVGAAAGLGAGAAGFGAPGVGAPGFAAALRGAAGFAEGLPAPPPGPCSASVSLRTTGASIVEDAERTNSPSSWSLAMTTLLSTPNSLASSYTRTLATSLLLGPGCHPDRRYFMGVLIAYSSSAHRNLDLLPTREVPDRTVARAVLLTVLPAGAAGRQPVRSMYRRSSAVSSGPGALNALGNARRRTARSRQTGVGCTDAPRPGSVPRGSGTTTPSITTVRSSWPLAARSRHPTQVRSGHARACVRPDTD